MLQLSLTMWYLPFLEKGLVPDFALKRIIHLLNTKKLKSLRKPLAEEQEDLQKLVKELSESPLAIKTIQANQQHYEVPSDFFSCVLGQNMKYSSAYWEEHYRIPEDLKLAEEKMLQLYLERGEFEDGQKVLELGCGWGSLSLYLAKRFPKSKITSISNSKTQKKFIEQRASSQGIKNLKIITVDINEFSTREKYDRIVSIEMFEHLRNYELLFRNLNQWLGPKGKLFFHIFCHHRYAYPFETKDDFDWMSRYFFSGGMMPAKDLFSYFSAPLQLERLWMVNGEHYAKTSYAWLANLDKSKPKVLRIFKKCYPNQELKYFNSWRVFFIAVAELFRYGKGNEWAVAHYLFKK